MDEVFLHKGFNERERRTAPKFTVSPDECRHACACRCGCGCHHVITASSFIHEQASILRKRRVNKASCWFVRSFACGLWVCVNQHVASTTRHRIRIRSHSGMGPRACNGDHASIPSAYAQDDACMECDSATSDAWGATTTPTTS